MKENKKNYLLYTNENQDILIAMAYSEDELDAHMEKIANGDVVPKMLNDEDIDPRDIVYNGDLKKKDLRYSYDAKLRVLFLNCDFYPRIKYCVLIFIHVFLLFS